MTQQSDVAAGWYHAPGDPGHTIRYWSGTCWQGEPVARSQPAQQPVGYTLVQPTPQVASSEASAAERAGLAAAANQRAVAQRRVAASRRKEVAKQLRGVALVISFLKLLPYFGLAYFAATDEGDSAEAAASQGPSLALIVLGGAAVVLLVQLVAVFLDRPGLALVPAMVLVLVDIYAVIVFFILIGLLGLVGMGFVAVAQLMVTTWAYSETFNQ